MIKKKSFLAKVTFFDLNSAPLHSHTFAEPRKEMADELWQNDLRSIDGLSSHLRISQVRYALSGSLQSQELFLLGSISQPGLRATDLSGKPARHRGLFACDSLQALSFGIPQPGVPQHLGQRQRRARLAPLRRLRPGADLPSAPALRPRRFRAGAGTGGLRPRFYHHRFVPGPFPLGQVPNTERGGKDAYPARSSWPDSHRGVDYRRQSPRRQPPRPVADRDRRHLSLGSRLSRFRPPAPNSSGPGLLCHPCHKDFPLPASLLRAGGQDHGTFVRPKHSPARFLRPPSLSRKAT